MIDSTKYCSQLDQVKAALDEKHPELVNRICIIIHQDNARPHASWMTRQKLLQLGWEILIHLPYSPDIAYQVFWFLQNSLNGKSFNSLEDCKSHLEQFFAQKDKNFGKTKLWKLPGKWQKGLKQMVNMLFNKVLGEHEKTCLLVFLKIQKNFLIDPIHSYQPC